VSKCPKNCPGLNALPPCSFARQRTCSADQRLCWLPNSVRSRWFPVVFVRQPPHYASATSCDTLAFRRAHRGDDFCRAVRRDPHGLQNVRITRRLCVKPPTLASSKEYCP
jgi:hypothetical protein